MTEKETSLVKPPNKIEIVRSGLQGVAESLSDALPSTMAKYLTPERLIKMTTLEVGRTPALLKCTTPSILRAAVDAATLGLEVGSTIGQSYLVPYRNNKTGNMEAHLIVGYMGWLALAARSGKLKSVDADIVRTNDDYDIVKGTETKLIHKPNVVEPPGEMLFAYCVAEFTNGGRSLTIMRKDEIDKVRKSSRAGSRGPWADWPDEMAKKTVIKRARKKWPISVQQLNQAASIENIAESGGHVNIDMDPDIRSGLKAAGVLPEPPKERSEAVLLELQGKPLPEPPDLLRGGYPCRHELVPLEHAPGEHAGPVDVPATAIHMSVDTETEIAPLSKSQEAEQPPKSTGKQTPSEKPKPSQAKSRAQKGKTKFDELLEYGGDQALSREHTLLILDRLKINPKTRSLDKVREARQQIDAFAESLCKPTSEPTANTSRPSEDRIDKQAADELIRLVIENNLATKDDHVGAFRFLSGVMGLESPHDLTPAQAEKVMAGLDKLLTRKGRSSG
jgi:recombination protein RecT